MTERDLYLRLNTRQWREGAVHCITIDDVLLEASRDRNQWRARAKVGEEWTAWTPLISTRWRAALTAYAASAAYGDQRSIQLSLPV